MKTTPILPVLVTVPGGSFVMGKDDRRDDERPAHAIRIETFQAATAPVTNAEYSRFVAATGYERAPFLGDERFVAEDQPVVGISWFDALAYCAWLTRETGLEYRLPTEAERELASLGGLAGVDWPWGDGLHPDYDRIANADRPHPPTEACSNGYGLQCMAENVHEWCSDWYAADYYQHSPAERPQGAASGKRRASRGGSWRHKEKFTRVTARSSIPPEFRYADYGFRVYAGAPSGQD